MTGLPEYRNGGLLIDLGLLEAKYPGVTEESHGPGEEVRFWGKGVVNFHGCWISIVRLCDFYRHKPFFSGG